MSEELRIEVDVKANDDSAKKTLDGLIKEYNNKPLEFQVKLGKFDISGISSSIARLTSDLNKLTNIDAICRRRVIHRTGVQMSLVVEHNRSDISCVSD